GQLYYYVYQRRFSPPEAEAPYSYDVEFPATGAVPADQHFTAAPSGLATITASYPATHPAPIAADVTHALLPWEHFPVRVFQLDPTPLQRTEYYTARPDLTWESLYYGVLLRSPFALLSLSASSWRTYQPGDSFATTWDGQPQHPRLLQSALSPGQVFCP